MRGTVYTELPVHDALAPYVRLVWAMESSDAAAFGSPERIVPDGVVELVFHFGVPFDMRYAGERFARQPIACVVSQTKRFIEIRPTGRSGFVAIRFHPWSARHFFADTIANLADRLTSAEDVWGRAAVDVLEQVAEAASLRQRSDAIQQFLIRRLRDRGGDVDRIARHVWLRRGDCRVASLCRELGISERRLQRTFASELGMTPKHFARLSRFLATCERIRQAAPGTTLATVAGDAGYFDQSHCAGEFAEFAGMSPSQFAAAQHVSALLIE